MADGGASMFYKLGLDTATLQRNVFVFIKALSHSAFIDCNQAALAGGGAAMFQQLGLDAETAQAIAAAISPETFNTISNLVNPPPGLYDGPFEGDGQPPQ